MNRGQATWIPVTKNNTAVAIAKIADDKYLTATDHPAARQKIRDLLTAAPQDFTHNDTARDVPSSLPRLHEIRIPTLILVGDADIPDVHAHSGAIETGIPNSRRIVVSDTGAGDESVTTVTSQEGQSTGVPLPGPRSCIALAERRVLQRNP